MNHSLLMELMQDRGSRLRDRLPPGGLCKEEVNMLIKLGEMLARLGIFRLLIALKALSSLTTGYIASKIRAHSKSVHTAAKIGRASCRERVYL